MTTTRFARALGAALLAATPIAVAAENYLFGDPNPPNTVEAAERQIETSSKVGAALFGAAAPEIVEDMVAGTTINIIGRIFGAGVKQMAAIPTSAAFGVLFGTEEIGPGDTRTLTDADRERARFARDAEGSGHEPGERSQWGGGSSSGGGGNDDADGSMTTQSLDRTTREPTGPPETDGKPEGTIEGNKPKK